MAHAHHNHGDMDTSPGDDMPMCNMNMIFNWDTNNLCIVFESWRITGTWSLIASLIGVVLLTAGYEVVREASRRYEARLDAKVAGLPRPTSSSFEPYSDEPPHEERGNSLVNRVTGSVVSAAEQNGRLIKAAFYGVQVFYSFFIMLLFMTYNAWIMLAVGVGAFLGYLFFSGSSAQKTAACH